MNEIKRKWNGEPTFFSDKMNDGDIFCNTLVGFGTVIIDKDFIDEMESVAEELKDNDNLITLMFEINNRVNQYYSSNNADVQTRVQAYDNNVVTDNEGMIIGTKLSSLKGLNVAKCSEKSIAAYVILNKLYEMGSITRKPSLVLSQISAESIQNEPHAFVMVNKECDDYTKHILFDVENPANFISSTDEKEYVFPGLYSLNDEEYNNLKNGLECSPTSLFELIGNYKESSKKRTYGNKQKNMEI